ncbi:hypothetical protein LRF89_02330 [Halorhodospira sp. 9621]|uniref:hypothetical protein n=1 Tax=Halorhodospira sp. 9621 TaxID=2899135 RepID=UPI001EE90C45|nr:hypothetical protein [Halorhodospira sp. 9621]MCG5532275.1 hypothetical protein [Halorhodospira sp. 9621]
MEEQARHGKNTHSFPEYCRHPRWALRIFREDVKNVLRFGKDAPRKYQLVYVPPHFIEWTLSVLPRPPVLSKVYPRNAVQIGPRPLHEPNVIVPGDWDKAVLPIMENRIVARTVRKLETGASWEAVGEIDLMNRLIEICGEEDGCRSRRDLVQRYRKLDELFAVIGSRRRLLPQSAVTKGRLRERGGIGLAISRTGRLILGDNGNHRLAAARYYGIPMVPACLQVVHVDFVRTGGWRLMLGESRQYMKKLARGAERSPKDQARC